MAMEEPSFIECKAYESEKTPDDLLQIMSKSTEDSDATDSLILITHNQYIERLMIESLLSSTG